MNDKKKKVINCFIALIIFICIIFYLLFHMEPPMEL